MISLFTPMKKISLITTLFLVTTLSACSSATDSAQYDNFASCLKEKGAVMYGTEWCPHCKKQKEMFEGSFEKAAYVDCDNDRQSCDDAGVQGYPTWILSTGEKLVGTQKLENLAEKTGCELPQETSEN